MLRTVVSILLILVGVVAIAGGVWGLSLQASSEVPAELLGAAQTVLDYADQTMNTVDGKLAEWTNDAFTLTGLLNDLTGEEIDLVDDASMKIFLMVHALEVLLGGVVGVETGLLLMKFRRG